jgi:hypothetical protein
MELKFYYSHIYFEVLWMELYFMYAARTYRKTKNFVSLETNTKKSLTICNNDTLQNSVLKALEPPLLQQPNYVEQRVRKRLCKTVFIINRLYIILYLFV